MPSAGTDDGRFGPPVWALVLLALPWIQAIAEERPLRTGEFVVGMTLSELVGATTAAEFESFVPRDEIVKWRAFVPPAYDPSRPPGLLVYISPSQSGKIPRGWKDVLGRHNLMWLAADRSGNRERVTRRILLAYLAVRVAHRHYVIDDERIYVSGLSGGGKTASMVATDYPHLFRGGIYNCGVEVWDVEVPRHIEQLRKNRFVFVTGTYDQALEPTKRAHRAYLDAGIEHSKLMVIRNMTHRNPGRYDFEEAIEYLDGGDAAADGGPGQPGSPPPEPKKSKGYRGLTR